MARIAKELNLSFPSIGSIKTTINKGLLKKVLKALNYTTLWEMFFQKNLPNTENLTFPLIIKPTISSGAEV